MEEKGFFILFGGLIVALFVFSLSGGTLSNTATSTIFSNEAATGETSGERQRTSRSTIGIYEPRPQDSRTSYISNDPNLQNRTETEIQAELEDLYDEVWELEQQVDSALRHLPESRYADDVRVSRAAATQVDPDREYLTLTLDQDTDPINISDWFVESYVTEERAAIPDGTKVYKDGGTINQTRPIVLEPGERAFLITGESPVNVSIQENICTGYLLENEDFRPRLSYNCPRPIELMERYGNISLDDDSCYDFVNRVGRCRMIEEDDPRLDELTSRCEVFVKEYLNYNSCVEAFSNRTDFHNDDDWYIYFERDEEKWRRKREIIRVIDQFDEVVAVVEY